MVFNFIGGVIISDRVRKIICFLLILFSVSACDNPVREKKENVDIYICEVREFESPRWTGKIWVHDTEYESIVIYNNITYYSDNYYFYKSYKEAKGKVIKGQLVTIYWESGDATDYLMIDGYKFVK